MTDPDRISARWPPGRTRLWLYFVIGALATVYTPLAGPIKVIDVGVIVLFLALIRPIVRESLGRPVIWIAFAFAAYSAAVTLIHEDAAYLDTYRLFAAWAMFLAAISMSESQAVSFLAGIRTLTFLVIGLSVAVPSVVEILTRGNRVGLRLEGFMSDPNRFAFVAGISLAISLGYFCQRGLRPANLIQIILFLVGITLTGSRGALLAGGGTIVVAIFLSVFIAKTVRIRHLLAAMVVVGLAGFVVSRFVLSSDTYVNAFQRLFELGFSDHLGRVDTRSVIWQLGLGEWVDSPLVGIGKGEFLRRTGWTMHSTYLEMLVSHGLIGTLVFFLIGTVATIKMGHFVTNTPVARWRLIHYEIVLILLYCALHCLVIQLSTNLFFVGLLGVVYAAIPRMADVSNETPRGFGNND